MLPVIIEDYIRKLDDKNSRPENRQFFYTTLVRIRDAADKAISKYERERNFKK